MLFGNVLCLLYLMVLVNSHTISKSVNEQKEIYDVYDNLNDYVSTTSHILHHDKCLHKHRRDKIEDTTKIKKFFTHIEKTKKTDLPKLHLRPVHKSTRRRIGGLWRKFKIKGRHEDADREKRLRQYLNKLSMSEVTTTFGDHPKMISRTVLNNKNEFVLSKKKRDALEANYLEITVKPTILPNTLTYRIKDELNIKPNENFTISSAKPYKSNAEDLKQMLSSIKTKVAESKDIYEFNNNYMKYTSPKSSSCDKYVSSDKESQYTVEETELFGTAQIEALLNSIKEKAISMIAEQNPAVTDVITNTVTEATFEADPILNHIEIVNPEYALSTLFSLKNINYDKSSASTSESEKDDTTKTYTQSHDIAPRSIKDEAISLAQNVEEKLQKELKSIYKKVKNKVSSDFKKEMHEVKSTIKQKMNSTLKKNNSTIYHKTIKNTSVTKPISSSNKHSATKSSRQHRREKDNKTTKVSYKQTTIDDYSMLTLFEEMLAKTHENNILRMVTTTDKTARKKRKEDLHISKQNIAALSGEATNKNVNNNYDDDEDQSSELYDYNIRVTIPDASQTVLEANDTEDGKITNADNNGNELKTEDDTQEIKYESNEARQGETEIKPSTNEEYLTGISAGTQSTDQTSFEDTSLENLSNKISYNEYVNGYKHYLNFQKQQANQNFSNMVKYQAHRHHSVDDIGKYILNKIPQFPQSSSRNKRFFDDYDIDDQDVATRSDDSWFKKHFYMFVDRGPPKKFHTSQTVSLKPPIAGINKGIVDTVTTSSVMNDNLSHLDARDNTDINLDELTKNLLNEKTSTVLLPVSGTERSTSTIQSSQFGKLIEIVPELKEVGPNLISKLFGKVRRTSKTHNQINFDKTERSSSTLKVINNDEELDDEFLWDNELHRYGRNVEKVLTNIEKEKQSTVKTKTTFGKQHGNVNVNIVPKGESNKLSPKVNFIKNVINLLHLGKHNNGTSKIIEREQRVKRFSPLKKFRDFFKVKPEDRLFKTNLNIPDYEIMKTHLDTFKPIKYNKILTVEEMENQIPNITDDKAVTFLKTNNMEPKKQRDNVSLRKAPVDDELPKNFEVTKTFQTYTKKCNKPKTQMRYQTVFTNADDVFKVNVKSLTAIDHRTDNILASTTRMTINDIRNELDDMRDRISSDDYNNNFINIPKTPTNYFEFKPKNFQLNNYRTLPHSTRSFAVLKTGHLQNLVDNRKIARNYNARNVKSEDNLNEYGQEKENKWSTKKSRSKQIQYDNLYNDLLIWHKDILQSDKVPTPWQDILKSIEPHNEYTPPKLEDLRKELTEVTNTLKENKEIKPPMHSRGKEPKTVKVDYDKTAEGAKVAIKKAANNNKNLIIQEETFRINKKIKNGDQINNLETPSYLSMKQEKHVDVSKDAKRMNDQSLIYLDTTLLSYDDDVNYITSQLTPNKLSRNSLKTLGHKHKATAAQTLTKINKQPQQYYSTPLPMHTNDFERFLKENGLDVASVTSPLIALPTAPTVNHYNLKTNSHTTTQKKINNKAESLSKEAVKAATVENFDRNVDEIDYLDELYNELYDDYYDGKVRYKRFNEMSNTTYVFTDITHGFDNTDNNFNKIEENKSIANPNIVMDLTNVPQKDIEVTIIDLGAMGKNIDGTRQDIPSNFHVDLDFRNPEKYTITTPKLKPSEPVYAISKFARDTTSGETNYEQMEKHTKDKEFFNKIHNNLLYNHDYTKKSTADILASHADGNIEKPLPLPVDILKEMPSKIGNKPKRVRISGQSYKYDIIYHHPEKQERGFSTPSSFEAATSKDFIFTDSWKHPSVNNTSARERTESIYVDLPTYYLPNTNTMDAITEVTKTLYERVFDYISRIKVTNFNSKGHDVTTDADVKAEVTTEQLHVGRFVPNDLARVSRVSGNNRTESYKDDLVYMEPGLYDDQVCFEYGGVKSHKGKRNLKEIISNSATENINVHKRDINDQGFYTAKDVAALEVVVDFMKNTLSNEEKEHPKPESYAVSRETTLQAVNAKTVTTPNSIQVHIAIPYENNDKRRSLKPVRVRKVFSARLSSPVDLEYQVHSLEGTPTDTTTTNDGLSPGIYLVVDNSEIPKAIALKPIKSDLTNFKRREGEIRNLTEKTVTKNPTKGLVKVTLNKDILSAISKHLALYSNLTEESNLSKNNEYTVNNEVKNNRSKRAFHWNSIKKYFEHHRICKCKCKANTTMCRACAASDAVMHELIFEFDNLAKYMNDHCTEIQTYFRMNPSGGKKLRDSVHKIDKSLKDYLKRGKGKCRGRTCDSFATYMDKRESARHNKIEKNVALNFINTLETIATDTEEATKLASCFNQELQEKRDKLIIAINNCNRNYNKRANTQKGKPILKNVYSLDNVNVNIICNADSSTPNKINEQNDINPDAVTQRSWNYYNSTKISKKHGKLKKLFSWMRKSKSDKNVAKKNKTINNKREVREVQIQNPLIADTGGSFWYDYINRRSIKPKVENIIEPDVKVSVIQTQNNNNGTNENKYENTPIDQNLKMISTISSQGSNLSKIWQKDAQNTSDPVLNKINDFLKILDNFKITKKPIEETTDMLTLKHNNSTSKATKYKFKNTKKPQNKTNPRNKTAKKDKKIKPKLNLHAKSKAKNATNKTFERNATTLLMNPTLEVIEKTKPNNLGKSELVTIIINDSSDFDKVNSQTDIPLINITNGAVNKETNIDVVNLKNATILYNGLDKHVPSEASTDTYPTILILNDYSEKPDKYRSLLLSIIDHETNKLNNEWLKYAIENHATANDVTEENKRQVFKHFKRMGRKNTKLTTKGIEDAPDENIINSNKPLERSNSVIKASEAEEGILKKIVNKLSKKVRGNDHKDKAVTEVSEEESEVSFGKKKTMKAKQSKEACDAIRTPQHLCDLKVTYNRILDMYKQMKRANFETYVRNITCYKYRKVPKYIVLNNNRSRTVNEVNRWDYKRRKRLTRKHSSNRNLVKDKINLNNLKSNSLKRVDEQSSIEDIDDFETFYKGDDNIYRCKKRKRRNASMNDVKGEMRNLPSIPSDLKEIKAIVGDTVTLNCFDRRKPVVAANLYTWKAERQDMLVQDNVAIDDRTVTIHDVKANNGGCYECCESTGLEDNFKLSVFTLPKFNVIHSAMYSMESRCTHQDLRALELIGSRLAELASSGACEGDAQEPVCLWDNDNGKAKIGVTVTLTLNPEPRVKCNVQCRRDIWAAMATLIMENVLILGTVQVMLVESEVNKLLKPSIEQIRSSNKEALSKNRLNPHLSVGTKFTLVCPAGYRLLDDIKLCAACPGNASAREGDNECFASPPGGNIEHDADRRRRLDQRTRRYDWWWYPPCGYFVAFGVILCCCGSCVVVACIVRAMTRSCRSPVDNKPRGKRNRKEAMAYASKHPQSPSRLILSKFFKASLTSSWATDSQDRKFEEWKGRNIPPPLPPVDFDVFDPYTSN